ncbi:MAG: hypothetical protein H7837_03900 [Magnetococcus sp. MYC-9]
MIRAWMERLRANRSADKEPAESVGLRAQTTTIEWDEEDLATTEPVPVEPPATPTPPEKKSTVADLLSYCVLLLLLLMLVPATIIATFEISNRVDFVALVDQEIAKQKSDLADLEKSGAKPDTVQKARSSVLTEINTLEKFKEAARMIMANGAIPLENDVFSFRDLTVLKAKSSQGSSLLASILTGESVINKSKQQENFPVIAFLRGISLSLDHFNDLFFGFINNYSSNSLMASSLIFSSIIGALVCFRKEGGAPFLLRFLLSGLVMGFVVYLIIKGGRNLFFFGRESDYTLSLDLYNACLLAFFAGMLAERIFRLFRSVLGISDQRHAP